MLRGHHSILVIFRFQKSCKKNYAKESDFALFWNASIWDGIYKHVHKTNIILTNSNSILKS